MVAQPISRLLSGIRSDLVDAADPVAKASEQRFFKEGVQTYGVKKAVVDAIGKNYLSQVKATQASKSDIFWLCDQLRATWKKPSLPADSPNHS